LVEQLQEAIRGSGQALNQISKQCGVDRSTLSRFMRNKHDLGLSLAAKVAAVLGLRLVGGDGASASARPEPAKKKPGRGKGRAKGE
jgi:transcriptional regulator with XRE-family HTH domain